MAIDELLKLEKDMKDVRSGVMDPRVLREFRDAVDYVRKTAWALQELQERQAQQRDTATVRWCAPCSPTSVSVAPPSLARRWPRIWTPVK
jgi:hypothetical protein